MNRKRLISFLFILPVFACSAQGRIKIKGCIKGMPYPKAYFAEIVGGQLNYLDSAHVYNSCFDFYVSDTLQPGMYSIIFNREHNSFIRILVNGREDIVFYTVFNKLLDSMSFSKSVENTTYYSYLKHISLSNEKKNLVGRLIMISTDNPTFVKSLKPELSFIEANDSRYAAELIKKYPNTIASAFIRALTPIRVPAGADTLAYTQEHYLDNIDFSNMALHRSDLLASAILNYISFVENKKGTFTELAEDYAFIFDKVMLKSAKNAAIYDFYRRELSNRYMYGNYDIIGNYFSEFYPEIPPQLPQGIQAVRNRLSKLNVVCIGKKAPEISLGESNGKPFTLNDIPNEYTLLVFWSSTCSHCTETLPYLEKLYESQKSNKLEVVAISFDTDKKSWQDYLKPNNFRWLNYSDLKGWQSEIAKAYHVKGTPTYILLDKSKWVISKPATFEELANTLQGLSIFN